MLVKQILSSLLIIFCMSICLHAYMQFISGVSDAVGPMLLSGLGIWFMYLFFPTEE